MHGFSDTTTDMVISGTLIMLSMGNEGLKNKSERLIGDAPCAFDDAAWR